MEPRATIFGCTGKTLSRTEATFFRDADPWGFILFLRNLESPDQIRGLTAQLRDTVGRNAPILIDQEGGRVARLLPPTWTGWDNALPFVEALPKDLRARAMRLRYAIIGAELSDLGIDVNCAPMVDVARDETPPEIRHRCYGTDPAEVAVLGRAVADGLQDAGVLPVLKHIPGHGRTPLDSHLDLPVVDVPLDVLEAEDFHPFAALADLPMAMTAHIVYTALDGAAPATLSRPAIAYIRDKIGFNGLLMTDDLSMNALGGRFQDRAATAFGAGCDMILHCNGDLAEMLAIAYATPRLSGASLARAGDALAARPPERSIDIKGLKAELKVLTQEGRHA